MHAVGSWPLFLRSYPPILLTPSFSNFVEPPSPLTKPPPLLLFLLPCLFGDCANDMILLLWIYTCRALVPWYQKDSAVCFMEQGVKLMKSDINCDFFTNNRIWYLSLKDTQHTQGLIDRNTHTNIYYHQLS